MQSSLAANIACLGQHPLAPSTGFDPPDHLSSGLDGAVAVNQAGLDSCEAPGALHDVTTNGQASLGTPDERARPDTADEDLQLEPGNALYGQKQVSTGSISSSIIGSAMAATVGVIPAQTSPILACDSRPADLLLTAGLNTSTLDPHVTLVACDDNIGDPNAQLRDRTPISSLMLPRGGPVLVSHVQASDESNGAMSEPVSACNIDMSLNSVLPTSPRESIHGYPSCIFVKNRDIGPGAPPDCRHRPDGFQGR